MRLLTDTQRIALHRLSEYGQIRAGEGFNLRTFEALERKGFCYVTYVAGPWMAKYLCSPESWED